MEISHALYCSYMCPAVRTCSNTAASVGIEKSTVLSSYTWSLYGMYIEQKGKSWLEFHFQQISLSFSLDVYEYSLQQVVDPVPPEHTAREKSLQEEVSNTEILSCGVHA